MKSDVCDTVMFDLIAEVVDANPERRRSEVEGSVFRFNQTSDDIIRRARDNDCITDAQARTIPNDLVEAIRADFAKRSDFVEGEVGTGVSERAKASMDVLEEYLG